MQAPSFDSVKKLAAKLALRVQRRLHSFGVRHIELDDLMQEAYVAYVLAARSWDSSRGVPFGLYFARGLTHHLNRVVLGEERQRAMMGLSLDEFLTPEEDGSTHEIIPAVQDDPERELLLKERGERVLRKLSGPARKILELLRDPPPFLFQQVEAIQARALYARSIGRNSVVAAEITLGLIADFLGLSRYERRQLYSEINNLAEKVSQS